MTAHSALCKGICEMLDRRGHYWYRTTNSGYGRKGAPDIYCCVNGLFAVIEAKVLPDKLSPWQARELEAIQNAKGRTCVAYSVGEAELFVNRLQECS